jgi:high-affinity iron transporter
MLQAFVITLREGLEAFLIVAISLAYLRKSGRHQLVPAVHWGIAVSLLLSVAAAWLFQRASNQALWEGILALVAAVLVGSLIVHMWRHAKRLKREIELHLESSAAKTGARAFAGVFLFTLLMITREGMETALLMGTLLFQIRAAHILIGAAAGTLCAAVVAYFWSQYGHRINLALFFQVTAVFLSVFVVQLLIYGFHELTEANLFPYSEPLHWATEPYGPDGRYGQYLSYLLVLLPMGWLAAVGLLGPRKSAQAARVNERAVN